MELWPPQHYVEIVSCQLNPVNGLHDLPGDSGVAAEQVFVCVEAESDVVGVASVQGRSSINCLGVVMVYVRAEQDLSDTYMLDASVRIWRLVERIALFPDWNLTFSL